MGTEMTELGAEVQLQRQIMKVKLKATENESNKM